MIWEISISFLVFYKAGTNDWPERKALMVWSKILTIPEDYDYIRKKRSYK